MSGGLDAMGRSRVGRNYAGILPYTCATVVTPDGSIYSKRGQGGLAGEMRPRCR